MKANELRLGNYILDVFDLKNTVIRKIDLEDLSMFINYSNHPLPFRPIPLTEEILLKCGFEKSAWDNFSTFRNSFCSDGCIVISLEHKYIEIGDLTLDIEIKYLHQLQNLIYALTNQELNVELWK